APCSAVLFPHPARLFRSDHYFRRSRRYMWPILPSTPFGTASCGCQDGGVRTTPDSPGIIVMTPTRFVRRTRWLALAALLFVSPSIYGQVTYPAPPKEYDVEIRFRLRAPLPGWFDLFDQMLADLKRVGFQRNARPAEEPEDPDNDRLYGIIAPENARKLLLHPNVKTILLSPRGWKPPAEPDKRVKVILELATGLPKDRQHVLSDQVLQQLD